MVVRLVLLVVAATSACTSRAAEAPDVVEDGEREALTRDLGVAFETIPAAVPFDGLVFDRTSLTIAGARATVSGSVDVRTHAIDLVARIGRIVATVRGTGAGARACVTDHVATATVVACGIVPASLDALMQLRALDVTWQLAGRDWRGHGTATLAWRDGEVVIDRGHAELVAVGDWFRGATAVAELHGTLSHLALDAIGEAHTKRLDVSDPAIGATFRDVVLPFALRLTAPDGVLALRTIAPLVARGTEVALQLGPAAVVLDHPTITIASAGELLTWPRRLDWSADDATWHDVVVTSPSGTIGDVDTLTWTAITGIGPIDGGAGALTFTTNPLRVASGWINVAGGVASVEPFVATGAPHDVVVRLASVELDPLLQIVGRGRVEGTGVLDGHLVVRLDGADSTLVSGTLRSHGIGAIRVADAALRLKAASAAGGLAIDKRAIGALADFEYSGFDAKLGAAPELQINMHGQGKHVPQELDLVVNLNGIRESVARRIR